LRRIGNFLSAAGEALELGLRLEDVSVYTAGGPANIFGRALSPAFKLCSECVAAAIFDVGELRVQLLCRPRNALLDPPIPAFLHLLEPGFACLNGVLDGRLQRLLRGSFNGMPRCLAQLVLQQRDEGARFARDGLRGCLTDKRLNLLASFADQA